MSTVVQFQPVSVRDYLAGECQARRKHEYVEGFVYAMAGATNSHNRLATNATVLLGSQLRGHRCQVFNSDTKVRVQLASGTRFYYPDTTVVCQLNSPDETYHDAPVVIIEILSDSTRRVDEYEKRQAYLTIDSLQAYLLVEQTSAAVLVYRRGTQAFEREFYVGSEAIIPLLEIGCELALAELYENVAFPVIDPLGNQEEAEDL